MILDMKKLANNAVKEAMEQIEINGMPFENFIMQADKLMAFLRVEIEIHEDRLNDKMEYPNPNYDGEDVGDYKVARGLSEKHINFCKRMLNILTDKDAY